MADSSVDQQQVTTDKVITNELSIGGVVVNKISYEYTENNILALATAKALNDLYIKLDKDIQEVAINKSVEDSFDSVITDSLTSSTLVDTSIDPEKGYEIKEYINDNNKLVYTGTSLSNYIRIPNSILTSLGVYFLVFTIDRLDSGYVDIVNNDGYTFGTLTSAGTHVVFVTTTNLTLDEFSIVAKDVTIGDTVIISNIKFHYVSTRLEQYINERLKAFSVDNDLTSFVTLSKLFSELANLQTTILDITESSDSDILSQLEAHKLTVNPHNITPDKIRAAHRVHTHTPYECGAAPEDHTHTPESIGAAKTNHTHTPESIGASPEDHHHDDRYLLKTDIITPKVTKPSIVLDAPLGFIPESYEHTNINLPTAIIKTGNLTHETDSLYSLSSGMITSNGIVDDASELYHAVQRNKYTQFIQDPNIPYTPVIINYRLHTPRDIKSVEVKRDLDAPYPTMIRLIKDNQSIRTYQIPWEEGSTSYILDLSSELDTYKYTTKLGLAVETLSIKADWKFSFDILFDDVNVDQFAINKDITFTYEGESTIQTYTLSDEDCKFTLSDMAIDHPYFVALEMTDTPTISVTGIPPQYGIKDRGVDPFLDGGYATNTDDEFYGILSTTSEHPNYPIQYIYQEDSESYSSELGTSAVTITHNFRTGRKVSDITLMFNKDELDYIPSSIIVEGKDISGNTITIFTNTQFIPDTINDNDKHVYLSVDIDRTITELILHLTNNSGAEIKINLLKVSLTSNFYNINKYTWSDGIARKYLGIIYKRAHGGYQIYSYPIGDSVNIPINGFSNTQANRIYSVMNPFGTKSLDVDLNCLKRSSSIIPPQASIEAITRDKIYIKTTTPDMFSINCFREW